MDSALGRNSMTWIHACCWACCGWLGKVKHRGMFCLQFIAKLSW